MVNDRYIRKILFGSLVVVETLKYKKYYFCGLRVFRWNKKLSKEYYSDKSALDLAVLSYRIHGASETQYNLCKLIWNRYTDWHLHINKHNFMLRFIYLYAAVLYERGEEKQAKHLLFEYGKQYGFDSLEQYPILASLALTEVKETDAIKKAAAIYSFYKSHDFDSKINSLIQNKTVAIVGNSSREIGKGLGAEIDAHDIVVRFNNYMLEGYEIHYGSKTSIAAKHTENADTINKKHIENCNCIIYKDNPAYIVMPKEVRDDMYNNIINHPEKIAFISDNVLNFAYSLIDTNNATTGLLAICAFYLARNKSFKDIDIYGFSFLDDNSRDDSHYDGRMSHFDLYHNMPSERAALRKLYFGDNRS